MYRLRRKFFDGILLLINMITERKYHIDVLVSGHLIDFTIEARLPAVPAPVRVSLACNAVDLNCASKLCRPRSAFKDAS